MISEVFKSMLSAKSVIRELSEQAARMAMADPSHPIEIYDYSLGNPSVPAPAEVNEKMIDILRHEDPLLVHGYSPSLGIPSVKEKIAASLNRRFGMNYKGTDIFPTSGAAGALAHAFRLVTEPGDTILTFAPYFPEYGPYIVPTGCHLKAVPPDTENFQIDFDALDEALTPDVMALLINTPNNPSGAMYSEETLLRLASLLLLKEAEFGHEIWLISDEPYREIVFDGKTAPYVSSFYPRTLSCYSFSKSLSLPGERIGYLAVNPACGCSEMLVQMCGQISRGIGHNCPSALMQLTVAETCDLTSDISVYETNMNLLYDALTDLGLEIVRPGGTFYMMPKCPEPDSNLFSRKALRYNLVLVPCDSFALPGYFRIAYCTDTAKVERSLDAFRKFIRTEY